MQHQCHINPNSVHSSLVLSNETSAHLTLFQSSTLKYHNHTTAIHFTTNISISLKLVISLCTTSIQPKSQFNMLLHLLDSLVDHLRLVDVASLGIPLQLLSCQLLGHSGSKSIVGTYKQSQRVRLAMPFLLILR